MSQSVKNRESRPSSLLLTVTVVALSWCALLYPPLPILELVADSAQYRAMSRSLIDGSILRPVDVSTVPHLASVMRPPLFPLALAATTLVPLDPFTALVAFHAIIALALLTIPAMLLREIFPAPLTALACGVALYSGRQVLWADMSEWLAMSLVTSATVGFLIWLYTRRALSVFLTTLFVALAVLTRTALIPWLIIPLLMVASSVRAREYRALSATAIALLPLALWGTAQMARLGSFSLGAYEGLNLLATARTLGELPSENGDSPETKLVLDRVNELGITASDGAFPPTLVHQWDGEFYNAYHHNFDQVCYAVQRLAPQARLAASGLAVRGFRAHASRYKRFLIGGVERALSEYLIFPLATLAIAIWLLIRSHRDRPLAIATITVCLIIVAYLTSIFASILWLHRYFLPVQSSLIFLSILSTYALVQCVRAARHRGESPLT